MPETHQAEYRPTVADFPSPIWALDGERVAAILAVDPARGLTESAVLRQRRQHGPNQLRAKARRSAWSVLADQIKGLMALFLAMAALLSFAFQNWVEGLAIVAVLAINTAIGFVTEIQAVRSMEALRRLGGSRARVRRAGQVRQIPAEELVPGDIVLLEGGDVISADMRLLQASRLAADESTLTGEPVPVDKQTASAAADAPLAERHNLLFKGTALTRGSAEAVVYATGMATELGTISSLTATVEAEITPLEKRLDRLGQRLIWLTLAVAALVGAAGFWGGKGLVLMAETAIALAVATIPEGLPVVATIALARGMWRMARRHVLINRLAAVETLGATSIICTDKTGTLTENRMRVSRLALAESLLSHQDGGWHPITGQVRVDGAAATAALEVAVLCNNAEPDSPGAAGDPMERALIDAAADAGMDVRALRSMRPEVREEAFDPALKMMATIHRGTDDLLIAVKGAPEAVIAACDTVFSNAGNGPLDAGARRAWLADNENLAARGLRVLALARRHADSADVPPYERLTLLGLVAFEDPPRADVPGAVARCRSAGIRVVMVTGDQPATARHIAAAVGLTDTPQADVLPGHRLDAIEQLADDEQTALRAALIFARVSPRQKLNLIRLHQQAGEIVAMTGDGVNDAPALKKADIGIAMGQRGTEVAREAADMVLKDDAFPSIAAAVEQGRLIFRNIRRFVIYLLSCNLSEVLVLGLATLAQAPLPILPLQILFLNLVTDVFPALALGVGSGDPGIMQAPPRPLREGILAATHWRWIFGYGVLLTACVLGAFAMALFRHGDDIHAPVTVSFLTLALAQLWHVFNMRAPDSGVLDNDVVCNPWVWAALGLCIGLVLAAVFVPPLASVLSIRPPDIRDWATIVGMSLLPLAIGQIGLRWARPARPVAARDTDTADRPTRRPHRQT